MWLKWLPWKILVRKFARSRGFLDPLAVLSRLRRFSQPSEVMEPIELLRAGFAFHARGLMNSRAIQQNLDWVWPYWVEKQFNPRDHSFVPRAFSLTHINLTHRNWTALGVPRYEELAIIDPRGLLTPFLDGWSLDAWIYTESGELLAPSRLRESEVEQELNLTPQPVLETRCRRWGVRLNTRVQAAVRDNAPQCLLDISARTREPAWLVLAVRPCNPEGVSFIHKLELAEDRTGWLIEGRRVVDFQEPPERYAAADYSKGDVALGLDRWSGCEQISCDVGMATAAAMFSLSPAKDGGEAEEAGEWGRELQTVIPLIEPGKGKAVRTFLPPAARNNASSIWRQELAPAAQLSIPDPQYQFLYESAVRSVILHSPEDVYPGPYTYKRFWFRDAAFILNAMLSIGLDSRVRRVLSRFPKRQTAFGYFRSQDGEWDSNGQALWILEKYFSYTGEAAPKNLLYSVEKGADWLIKKRLPQDDGGLYSGLLPAGFSAEHLGANDFYYWDDFWAAAGLRSAAEMMQRNGKAESGRRFSEQADDLLNAIARSLRQTEQRLGRKAVPAAPGRRLDAGAIGSLASSYPLQLWAENDSRLTDTVAFLMDNCMLNNGFFQDMTHSGINPYLTLHLAQTLLRAGDPRFFQLVKATADLASPTGQWPEAIHPFTQGGCMGDGQHIWAAAEWIMMIRNSFLYEEQYGSSLVLGAGLAPSWLESGQELSFTSAPTCWGKVTLRFTSRSDGVECKYQADWTNGQPTAMVFRLPGCEERLLEPAAGDVVTIKFAGKSFSCE